MRDANKGTPSTEEAKDEKAPAPGAQTGKSDANAKADPGKLPDNRRRLGVDEEHRTPAMKRGKRGTFP